MAHPHRGAVIDVGEQIDRVIYVERCLAVFAPLGGLHPTPQLLHQQLHAVANPEHGDAQVPEAWVTYGRPGRIHGAGAATEDDPLRRQLANLFEAGAVSQHQRIHLGFPDPTGNQFGILGAKIKDDDGRAAPLRPLQAGQSSGHQLLCNGSTLRGQLPP